MDLNLFNKLICSYCIMCIGIRRKCHFHHIRSSLNILCSAFWGWDVPLVNGSVGSHRNYFCVIDWPSKLSNLRQMKINELLINPEHLKWFSITYSCTAYLVIMPLQIMRILIRHGIVNLNHICISSSKQMSAITKHTLPTSPNMKIPKLTNIIHHDSINADFIIEGPQYKEP